MPPESRSLARARLAVVAKAARGGYDGRGVIVVESGEESEAASQLGPVIVVEELVNFDQEMAMVARRPSGEIVTYPPVSTVQRDGMCAENDLPCRHRAGGHAGSGGQLAIELATVAELVGVMAIELFVVGDQLLVRTWERHLQHRAPHYRGRATSQFEQHVRAILDLPLGSTALRAPAAAMYNIIGAADGHDPRNDLSGALGVAGANVHLYGKSARPNPSWAMSRRLPIRSSRHGRPLRQLQIC